MDGDNENPMWDRQFYCVVVDVSSDKLRSHVFKYIGRKPPTVLIVVCDVKSMYQWVDQAAESMGGWSCQPEDTLHKRHILKYWNNVDELYIDQKLFVDTRVFEYVVAFQINKTTYF